MGESEKTAEIAKDEEDLSPPRGAAENGEEAATGEAFERAARLPSTAEEWRSSTREREGLLGRLRLADEVGCWLAAAEAVAGEMERGGFIEIRGKLSLESDSVSFHRLTEKWATMSTEEESRCVSEGGRLFREYCMLKERQDKTPSEGDASRLSALLDGVSLGAEAPHARPAPREGCEGGKAECLRRLAEAGPTSKRGTSRDERP